MQIMNLVKNKKKQFEKKAVEITNNHMHGIVEDQLAIDENYLKKRSENMSEL